MNIFTWNVKGSNQGYKQKELKEYIANNSVRLIAIIETRVKMDNADSIAKKMARGWNWINNYSMSPRVYGLHTINDRKILWEELRRLHDLTTTPWLAMGDYNAIKDASDRMHGTIVLGDANNAFFYASMKGRLASNGINNLVNSIGDTIQDQNAIEEEVIGFYKSLLGTNVDQLPTVDTTIMQQGKTLSRWQQMDLIQPVTREEVIGALKDMDDLKAPGCDGFTTLFLKKAWVLPKRMQQVMDDLVDKNQASFIPGRVITDNIILSHELVRGYASKGISARVMLKIDMRKAYDSVEWAYLEQILVCLKFPENFVKWIMKCVSTISYLVLINGGPTTPFQAKKGLRQGDPLSPFLFVLAMEDLDSVKQLFQGFQRFSQASGLSANLDKSSIYFGGVKPKNARCHIANIGICQRVKLWTVKFLSYAGRVQLIKTILFSIQVYWSQIVVLPEQVVKMIEATCRTFLWTGQAETSKKSLIAWDKLCYPKVTGGLNILDVKVWNKAAICKLLWTMKDFKAQKYFESAGYDEVGVLGLSSFSIKSVYSQMRGVIPKVDWRRMVCNNQGAPKWLFILYIAVSRKLLTRTRLAKWGTVTDVKCFLCDREDKDIDHLLFGCTFSGSIREKILEWQGIKRRAMTQNRKFNGQ
ncbi:uncharacterized protein LOC132053828 [Lycium ferocissimum]|uniref:uncharacterized protein LOC132053828 n=1 Tax=Lycium ferocissimum TaxID=112874 RepID=UPI0028160FB3|nr:uncharacterized protein LOC132053828 [Lycium ferocissimum]